MNTHSFLQTPVTHDPAATTSFYRNLGFEEVTQNEMQLFTDGKVLVYANPERTARVAIRMCGDWSNALDSLTSMTHLNQQEERYVLSDPSGVQVVLEPEMTFEVSGDSCSSLGNFAGLSIETTDFSRSLRFWETLGYKVTCGAEAQGWVTLEQEGYLGISVMNVGACPHLFFSPGLTFFNSGKNLENIAKIKQAGIEFTEEISCFNPDGVVDNVILRDPGGTGFFIFND